MPQGKDENRERMRRWRRAQGMQERKKGPPEPWKAFGVSRSTWFRTLREERLAEERAERQRREDRAREEKKKEEALHKAAGDPSGGGAH